MWVFWILCFAITFAIYLQAVLQGMAKNNPTEKLTDAEMQATSKHGPARKLKIYRCKLQRQI